MHALYLHSQEVLIKPEIKLLACSVSPIENFPAEYSIINSSIYLFKFHLYLFFHFLSYLFIPLPLKYTAHHSLQITDDTAIPI